MMNNHSNNPLMSFWPQVFNRIINGDKLLEYRRVFPKNCEYCFMYISSPVKAICGIIYFDKVIRLDEQIGLYDIDTDNRIYNYLHRYRYAGTIKAVQKIKPITLEQLKKGVPDFTAPQSYLYIDNKPKLKEFICKNLIYDGDLITNNLNDLLPNHLCK